MWRSLGSGILWRWPPDILNERRRSQIVDGHTPFITLHTELVLCPDVLIIVLTDRE